MDNFNIDILCLQEIKATVNEVPKCFNKEFKNSIINSSTQKGLSGTLTYLDIEIENHHFCKFVDSTCEGRIIEHHYRDIVIFNVYFPNGKSSSKRLNYKISFYKKFYKYCEELRARNKSIIICGDFNTAHKDIDLKQTKISNRTGFSDKERSCLDKFIKKGYIDTFRYIHGDKKISYSWWSYRSNGREKNEGWRIDYILISSDLKEKLREAFILDNITGSDHCPIGINIDI